MLVQLFALVALILPAVLGGITEGWYRITNLESEQAVVVNQDQGNILFKGQPDPSSDIWDVQLTEKGYALYNVGLNCVAGLGPVPPIYPPLSVPVRCFNIEALRSSYTFQETGENVYRLIDRAYSNYVWQGRPGSDTVMVGPSQQSDDANWLFTAVNH